MPRVVPIRLLPQTVPFFQEMMKTIDFATNTPILSPHRTVALAGNIAIAMRRVVPIHDSPLTARFILRTTRGEIRPVLLFPMRKVVPSIALAIPGDVTPIILPRSRQVGVTVNSFHGI